MKFNTAIAKLMSLVNDFYKKGSITKDEMRTFLVLLNPTAPHITEEMWQICGYEGTIAETDWPKYDDSKTIDNEVEIVLQINGKIKDKLVIASGLSKDEMEAVAKENAKIKELTEGKQIVKIICVPGKLINVVVR